MGRPAAQIFERSIMLPEKLTLQDLFDFIDKLGPKKVLTPEETNDCEKIVRYYNAYPDQQAEIERLKKPPLWHNQGDLDKIADQQTLIKQLKKALENTMAIVDNINEDPNKWTEQERRLADIFYKVIAVLNATGKLKGEQCPDTEP